MWNVFSWQSESEAFQEWTQSLIHVSWRGPQDAHTLPEFYNHYLPSLRLVFFPFFLPDHTPHSEHTHHQAHWSQSALNRARWFTLKSSKSFFWKALLKTTGSLPLIIRPLFPLSICVFRLHLHWAVIHLLALFHTILWALTLTETLNSCSLQTSQTSQ